MKFFFRSDRRALLLLFIVILAVWAGIIIDRKLLRQPSNALPALDEMVMDSLAPAQKEMGREGEREALEGDNTSTEDERSRMGRQAETFAFDPNTADEATLLRLGLAPWQAKSILKYRSRGGRYHRTEDFKRVPGMTPEVYERLAPVIHIDRAFRYYDDNELKAERSKLTEHQPQNQRTQDSLTSFPHNEKFKQLTIVDLNSTDTTELKHIPGIASYRARQIIRYRERLGGYASIEQLKEIEGLPADELARWFDTGKGVYRRIPINKATVAEMGKHPYMGFTRARAIDNYRRNYGVIHDLSELLLLPDFTEEVITRLIPYVEY